MKKWQLQEAKAKFSEVVRRALREGPQAVTRHDRDTVVVMSMKSYEKIAGDRAPKDLLSVLRTAPSCGGPELFRYGNERENGNGKGNGEDGDVSA